MIIRRIAGDTHGGDGLYILVHYLLHHFRHRVSLSREPMASATARLPYPRSAIDGSVKLWTVLPGVKVLTYDIESKPNTRIIGQLPDANEFNPDLSEKRAGSI